MTRKETLNDLLLILNTFYGNEKGVKYLTDNYSNATKPEKVEDGIDIAVEMLYDKMNEGYLLKDVAKMLKKG